MARQGLVKNPDAEARKRVTGHAHPPARLLWRELAETIQTIAAETSPNDPEGRRTRLEAVVVNLFELAESKGGQSVEAAKTLFKAGYGEQPVQVDHIHLQWTILNEAKKLGIEAGQIENDPILSLLLNSGDIIDAEPAGTGAGDSGEASSSSGE